MVRFAREIRWAIVASGTRNALAISAVVRPPTARSVRAIEDAGVNAGWAHMKSRASESSSSTAAVDSGSRRLASSSRFDRALLAPPLVDQSATGRHRQPRVRVRRNAVARPVVGGGDECLLDGVLRRVEVARATSEAAEDLRRQAAKQVLDRRRERSANATPRAVSRKPSISATFEGDDSMIWRTMIGCSVERPP